MPSKRKRFISLPGKCLKQTTKAQSDHLVTKKNPFKSTVPFCVCPSSIFSSMATFLRENLAHGISQKLNQMLRKRVLFPPGQLQQQWLGQVLRAQLRLPRASCLLGDWLSSVISFKLLFREDYQFFFSKLPIVYHSKQVLKQTAG